MTVFATLVSLLVLSGSFDKSMQGTAVLALQRSQQFTADFESGGIILQNKKTKKYTYTIPITDKDAGGVFLPVQTDIFSKSYTTVGFYHTHPCVNGYIHHLFSVPDAAYSLYSYKISYILDGCTGKVYEFDPSFDPVGNVKYDGFVLTSGRQIGIVGLTITIQ